jgi:hypothetical protein
VRTTCYQPIQGPVEQHDAANSASYIAAANRSPEPAEKKKIPAEPTSSSEDEPTRVTPGEVHTKTWNGKDYESEGTGSSSTGGTIYLDKETKTELTVEATNVKNRWLFILHPFVFPLLVQCYLHHCSSDDNMVLSFGTKHHNNTNTGLVTSMEAL